uniref:Complex III subunit 9 n=1 Tax=Cucumis melo TaxID=3656 RepID=A0A9I9EFY0_CUCME
MQLVGAEEVSLKVFNYRVIMRRNSVYVTFIIADAFVGEQAVDYGVHKLWEHNNVGVCDTDTIFFVLVCFI